MRIHDSFGWLALTLIACGGESTDITDFEYGGNQPGAGLPEGGEIRHENVRILGMPEQTWIHIYQYNGPPKSANAPFPAPADGGNGIYGNCVDERDPATATWPVKPIEGATYLDFPKVPEITGTGITGTLQVPKTDPVNTVGNSTFRTHDFTYGGGAPGDPPEGFNGTLTAAQSAGGGTWHLDVGIGEPMEYHMPPAYDTPLGIGGATPVQITDGQDLVLEWNSPANDMGDSGNEHTRKTWFNFTFFADPTAAFPPLFICFPEEPGKQTIPAAVISELPPGGLIVHANMAHYMEALDAGGEDRRFDLVTIWCNISAYEKQ